MKRNAIRLLCLMLSISLLLGGCSQSQTASADGCLELANSPSTTLDNVWYNPGGIFRCGIFDSLLLPDAQMETLSGALAEEYSVLDKGRCYTFQLRENVTWHDGEPFDGEDVLFSVKAMLRSSEVNGVLESAFQYIEGAPDYSTGQREDLPGLVLEGRQVTFKLSGAPGNFLDAVAQFAILPEHLLGQVAPEDLTNHDFWKHPVGTGCYRVAEAVEGDYFLLETYSGYYGPKPGISQLRIRLNVTDAVAAMEEGKLDLYVTNDPEEISRLNGIENCSSHQLNILFPAYLIMNLTGDSPVNEALKDVRVRKALLLALDREAITRAIFPGSSVSDTMIPAWDRHYWSGGEDLSFDPQRARILLEAAEFDFTQPLRLRYSTKGQSTMDLMNAIAVYWRDIGIQVDLQKFDGSGSEHMFEIRDFDVCYKRLSAFDRASIYGEIYGDAVMQQSLLQMPVYDGLINQLSVSMKESARKEILRKMQQIDQEYLLRLPLFALANVVYTNDARFQMPDAYGNLWYRYDLRFQDWRLSV